MDKPKVVKLKNENSKIHGKIGLLTIESGDNPKNFVRDLCKSIHKDNKKEWTMKYDPEFGGYEFTRKKKIKKV